MINKIKAYRMQKKLTQVELSTMAGVSRTTISGLESGRVVNTTADTLLKLSKALGGTINDIFFAERVEHGKQTMFSSNDENEI